MYVLTKILLILIRTDSIKILKLLDVIAIEIRHRFTKQNLLNFTTKNLDELSV